MARSGIYIIINTVTSDCYIGSAKDIDYRVENDHFKQLRKGKHKMSHSRISYLQYAFTKYGESAFVWEILEIVENLDGLTNIEKRLILETVEKRWIETILELRGLEPSYNVKKSFEGHWAAAEETKEKIRKALEGRTLSPEHRKAISDGSPKERVLSDEERQRRSDGAKEMWKREEYKENVSNALKDRTFSDSHREKLSQAWEKRRQRPISDETRKRLSESSKKAAERKRQMKKENEK